MRIEPLVEAELSELCDALASQPAPVVRRALTSAVLALFASAAVVETPAGRRVGVAAATEQEPLPLSDTNGTDPELLFAAGLASEPNGFDPPGRG